MELSDLEQVISNLQSGLDDLRYQLTCNTGLIIKLLQDVSEEEIINEIKNNQISADIINYIIDNYTEFNAKIIYTILESPHYSINFWTNSYSKERQIFYDCDFILAALKNPNLPEWDKEKLKKRIAKHKRDLKKNTYYDKP